MSISSSLTNFFFVTILNTIYITTPIAGQTKLYDIFTNPPIAKSDTNCSNIIVAKEISAIYDPTTPVFDV